MLAKWLANVSDLIPMRMWLLLSCSYLCIARMVFCICLRRGIYRRSFSIVDSYVVFPCIFGILGFRLVSLLGLSVGAFVACGTYGKAYFLFSSGFFFSLSCYSFFQRSFSFGISFAGMRCASSSAFT